MSTFWWGVSQVSFIQHDYRGLHILQNLYYSIFRNVLSCCLTPTVQLPIYKQKEHNYCNKENVFIADSKLQITTTTADFNKLLLLLNICLTTFSRTTWICRYQKDQLLLDFNEADITGWQWHQPDPMQVICTMCQTDNHTSSPTPHHSVFTGQMFSLPLNQQRQHTEGNGSYRLTGDYHIILVM